MSSGLRLRILTNSERQKRGYQANIRAGLPRLLARHGLQFSTLAGFYATGKGLRAALKRFARGEMHRVRHGDLAAIQQTITWLKNYLHQFANTQARIAADHVQILPGALEVVKELLSEVPRAASNFFTAMLNALEDIHALSIAPPLEHRPSIQPNAPAL
jgi:hypothetical protein